MISDETKVDFNSCLCCRKNRSRHDLSESGSEWVRVNRSGLECAQSGSQWVRVGRSDLEWIGVDLSEQYLNFLSIFFSKITGRCGV